MESDVPAAPAWAYKLNYDAYYSKAMKYRPGLAGFVAMMRTVRDRARVADFWHDAFQHEHDLFYSAHHDIEEIASGQPHLQTAAAVFGSMAAGLTMSAARSRVRTL